MRFKEEYHRYELITIGCWLLSYVLILGVFSSAIAYVAWTKALSVAEKTSQVSNYMFLIPLLTSALGFWIASEISEQLTIIGGTIILSGILLFNYGRAVKRLY